jgi:iron-sulfur cluster repair protein YtfE (RIC family)
MGITQPIRDDHRHLLEGIESLKDAGDLIGEVAFEIARKETEEVLHFLRDQLIPHARAEEAILYPVVGRLMGASGTTRTMTRDHLEISVLTGKLERAVEERDLQMMRRLLYGLYHLVSLHFLKEEEIYLPLLDQHLTWDQAEDLFHAMHASG